MKKNLLSALFIGISSCSFSQSIQWQNTIGGNNTEWLSSILQTSDGGYFLGGWSESNISGDKNENCIGAADYWVVKLDSAGTIQWQNTIGGSSLDYMSSAQQTADGGYILGGWSRSDISGDKTENSIGSGSDDYWVVKLDSSGNIEWQNTIGGDGSDWLYAVQQTADHGYVLGGWSDSNISGDKTQAGFGVADYWVVKLDSGGNIQWQNTIGGNLHDLLFSVQQTSDGGYILGGSSYSDSSGLKTENSLGGVDCWVVKLDSAGSIEWQNTIGGADADWLNAIEQTGDKGYILGAMSSSNISGDKTENSLGASDYWIVKLDSSGNIQWQKTIGGDSTDYLNTVHQTADHGYILGGYSYSGLSGSKTENSNGDSDYWIVKLDSAGTILWQNTIGGNYSDFFSSLQQTRDGGYILGGFSSSTISGDKTENSIGFQGYTDYWVVKINDTTGINSIHEIENAVSLKIFPNPAAAGTTLSFYLNKTSRVEVNIVNILGGKILERDFGTLHPGMQRLPLILPAYHPVAGIYFVEVNAGEERHSLKLMVE